MSACQIGPATEPEGDVLIGSAHVAVCVPDVDVAVTWYEEKLGLTLLSPPYRMQGARIDRDMGELLPPPVVVKAAIMGFAPDDHVLELIEYPEARSGPSATETRDRILTHGITHLGLLCDDLDQTRSELEGRGVEFLTSGIAELAGLKTAWIADPWGSVFILLEKKHHERPYWRQHSPD
jgi:catechol 2,3-dioxygenase-like lactoylglutathione lyase family enzyme